MGLGASILGAIVGAAVGVGLHQVLEVYLHIEAPWFAVIIGILTGLGVRMANKSLAGNVSYLRGAITGLIALGAIVGSIQLVSVLAARKGAAETGKAVAAAATEEAKEEDAKDEGAATEETPANEPVVVADATLGKAGGGKAAGPGEPNVMQFIFMAVGAFIAYELGRGSGATAPAPVGEPVVMMDPSN